MLSQFNTALMYSTTTKLGYAIVFFFFNSDEAAFLRLLAHMATGHGGAGRIRAIPVSHCVKGLSICSSLMLSSKQWYKHKYSQFLMIKLTIFCTALFYIRMTTFSSNIMFIWETNSKISNSGRKCYTFCGM